ncbi:MAG: Cof-type HAD-IIB family hydrolase [Oscillospiraceae bacterium]|nr:Cof-type HAD-IIB family hydrolase [Oscillospiraceae bacterium]
MPCKAIFFDMDGTLTSLNGHSVSDSTLEALRIAKEQGVKLFLATGRHHLLLLNPMVNAIPFDAHLTANGQFCYKGKEVIRRHPIPKTDIAALVRHLETARNPVMFQTEHEIFVNMEDPLIDAALELIDVPRFPIRPPETCLGQDVFELLLFGDVEVEEPVMRIMPGSKAVRWVPLFTDIIPADGGKDVGVAAVLGHYGIDPAEAMAFGDGHNDISMLRHVGLGVAMGNAAQAVKDAADHVTDSVDADGIYKALKYFGVI